MVQYPQQSSNTRHWRTLYPAALILSVYFASGQSKLASPQFHWLLTSDKLIHFCVFGLLATLVLRSPLALIFSCASSREHSIRVKR